MGESGLVNLAQSSDKWQAVVDKAINLGVL